VGLLPAASIQYGFVADPESELYDKLDELYGSDGYSEDRIDYTWYGTDGCTGLCVYAIGSRANAQYASCNIALAPKVSMEKEFKETMEDFCREYNIEDATSSWCLCSNFM
jgi:hypothetical protein